MLNCCRFTSVIRIEANQTCALGRGQIDAIRSVIAVESSLCAVLAVIEASVQPHLAQRVGGSHWVLRVGAHIRHTSVEVAQRVLTGEGRVRSFVEVQSVILVVEVREMHKRHKLAVQQGEECLVAALIAGISEVVSVKQHELTV